MDSSSALAAMVAACVVLLTLPDTSVAQRRGSRLAAGTGATPAVDFDCPEEFGYYPHPSDCTQYYVCVFGGAVLESCTGGLMYSHELQTCDWPRNVGCGAGESATISTVRVTDPRTRQTTTAVQAPSRSPAVSSRSQNDQQRQQQDEIVKHQLYADDVGPAEEIESNHQQRVNRGQPSTLGQVQRDRDGLRHQAVNNVIPASTGRVASGEKIGVISFGTQQQPAQNTQYSIDPMTVNNYLTIETARRREKRQVHFSRRYQAPSQVLRIVPLGTRLPWSNPQPPPGSRFSTDKSRPSDPITPTDSGFKPIADPNIQQTDVRNFRSPDISIGTHTLPNQGQFANTNQPFSLAENFRSSHTVRPLVFGSTIETTSAQKGSSVHNNSPHLQKTTISQPYTRNIADTLPGIIYYKPLPSDESYSFFNFGDMHQQNNPFRFHVTSFQNNISLPVVQATPVESKSSNNKPMKGLTSMHEVPYNKDGTRLYQVATTQALEKPLKPQNNFVLPSESGLSTFPSYTNPWFSLDTGSGTDNHNREQRFRNIYKEDPYFRTIPRPDKINDKNTKSVHSNKESVTDSFIDTSQTQIEVSKQVPRLSKNDSSASHGNIKNLAQIDHNPTKTQIKSTPHSEHNTDAYDTTGSDYYEDEEEDDHFPRAPAAFYDNVNKYRHIENPFASINFDFDKYLDKLRGSTNRVSTTTAIPVRNYNHRNLTNANNDNYEYYEDDYEEDSEDKKPSHFQNDKSVSKSKSNNFLQSQTPQHHREHTPIRDHTISQITTNYQSPRINSQLTQTPTEETRTETNNSPHFNNRRNPALRDSSSKTQANNLNKNVGRLRTLHPEDTTPSTIISQLEETPSSKYVTHSTKAYLNNDELTPTVAATAKVISNDKWEEYVDKQQKYEGTTEDYADYEDAHITQKSISPSTKLRLGDHSYQQGPIIKTLDSYILPMTTSIPNIDDNEKKIIDSINKYTGSNFRWPGSHNRHFEPNLPKNITISLTQSTSPRYSSSKITAAYNVSHPNSSTVSFTEAPSSVETYTIRRRPEKHDSHISRGRKPLENLRTTNVPPTRPITVTKPTPTVFQKQLTYPPKDKNPIQTTKKVRTMTTDEDSYRSESYDRPTATASNRLTTKSLEKDDIRSFNRLRVDSNPVQQTYVQQPSSTSYNRSQQYDSAQYDPYYNVYDDDVELYRDVDYSQYSNQGQSSNQQQPQYRGQSPYKQQPVAPPQQQQPQRTSSYAQPSYTTQDIYSQTDNDNYNSQLAVDQIQYQDSVTASPTRGDRNELQDPTSTTTIPTTTSIRPSTTTTRPQARQRGEINSIAATRSSATQSDSTKDTTWSQNDQISNRSPLRPNSRNVPTTSRQGNSRQAQGASTRTTETEGRRGSHRISLTASLSLQDPFSENSKPAQQNTRNQNSRRFSVNVDSLESRPISRSEISDVLPSRTTPLRSQSRKISSKTYEVVDSSPDSYLSLDDGVISIESVPRSPSIESSRKGIVKSSEETRFTSRGSPQNINRDSDTEIVNNARIKAAADPRQSAKLISDLTHVDPDSDEDNISDLDSSRRSLSRNSIETTTTVRARSTTTAPPKENPCSDDIESNRNTGCSEKVRVRPTTAPPDSQTTPGLARGSGANRNRGNSPYISAPGADTVNRGTPASVRTRPTLKPSTAFVSKAAEFVDIYKYPPSRPQPVYPTPQVDKTAAKCRKDVCLLPDCNCGGKDIPGDLPVESVPQLVLLTFDDSTNDLNKGLYSDLFEKGRKNPNGCPISATFYVSHEWTDYSHVQNLYATGHEIASHSISHSFGEQFSQKKWTKEIAGQREILSQYGGVRLEDIRGMRAPFLAIGGNKMFKMLYDSNFTYDSSMPVYENRPPSWPYTLDYKIFHDCMIPPCPTKSYPGVWEVPMVMWQDLNGGRCSMGDACSNPPTADGVYKMLIKNFERHYTTNRAPFGLFYHAAWFTQPHHKEGFEAFLDTIVSMEDVWLVTNWQAVQWIRDPTPLSKVNNFPPFQCNYPERPKKCNNPKVCNLWHKSGVRYMRTCQPCPDVYPWTGKTGVRNSRVDNEIIEE